MIQMEIPMVTTQSFQKCGLISDKILADALRHNNDKLPISRVKWYLVPTVWCELRERVKASYQVCCHISILTAKMAALMCSNNCCSGVTLGITSIQRHLRVMTERIDGQDDALPCLRVLTGSMRAGLELQTNLALNLVRWY